MCHFNRGCIYKQGSEECVNCMYIIKLSNSEKKREEIEKKKKRYFILVLGLLVYLLITGIYFLGITFSKDEWRNANTAIIEKDKLNVSDSTVYDKITY